MEKIIHNGEEGYFLKEEEKEFLKKTAESYNDYRESTRSLSQIMKEVKV